MVWIKQSLRFAFRFIYVLHVLSICLMLSFRRFFFNETIISLACEKSNRVQHQKYKLPVQLFIFFEKLNSNVWGSNISKENCSFCFIPSNFFWAIAIVFKNELFLSASYLVDASCVDFQKVLGFSKNEALVFYVFYFLFFKKRVVLCFVPRKSSRAIDSIYPSACWLEREFVEMFGVFLSKKVDSRNLLLDYCLNENPLLKNYPVSGCKELHYSILAEGLVYNESSSVEL